MDISFMVIHATYFLFHAMNWLAIFTSAHLFCRVQKMTSQKVCLAGGALIDF